jgi:cellulose synthase/poly-beta-1,6-N-acetylglucosamine synthase-like glycosyltransferase
MHRGQYIQNKQLSWLTAIPANSYNKVALVIPQYNESSSNLNFIQRLDYYRYTARQYGSLVDVVLIDDGSTDNSLQILSEYAEFYEGCFHVAKISANSNKVGALFLAARELTHDFIFFSDFDTDLAGLEHLRETCRRLAQDGQWMGCYFKMVPLEDDTLLTRYQIAEYSFLRNLYRFHRRDASVPVMPGAGCMYKREVILMIFAEHSGLRSGEDRESAVIGQRLGYKVLYQNKVRIITRTPPGLSYLLRQRIRWNLGYLETVYFERDFYLSSVKSLSVMGLRSLFDAVNISSVITLPILFLLCLKLNVSLTLLGAGVLYLLKILWIGSWLASARQEFTIDRKFIPVLLTYPAMRFTLENLAWLLALCKFVGGVNRAAYHYTEPEQYALPAAEKEEVYLT